MRLIDLDALIEEIEDTYPFCAEGRNKDYDFCKETILCVLEKQEVIKEE